MSQVSHRHYQDQPLPVEADDLETAIDDDMALPVSVEKHAIFKGVLKNILPYIGSDEGKIILTEVMIALKLEGIVGKELNSHETKMVNVIKDAILREPKKKRQALKLAEKLLESHHEPH